MRPPTLLRDLCLLAAPLAAPAPALAQYEFVNWETPHVSPLALTPDGTRLLAVNTADDRLEVFDVTGPVPAQLAAIPVGVDPVSVRARTNREVWVVNHLSDSVSVVDLVTGNVEATLDTEDEPCDVVFAGWPRKAFVSCSQTNAVLVFDPRDLGLAPVRLALEGEDPRMLAVDPGGTRVYAAIFESGNGSTVLGGGGDLGGTVAFPPNVVSDPAGPHGGQNPPPNNGSVFEPPINPALPAPPAVGLIVKKDAAGRWRDDVGADWTPLVSGPQAALSGRVQGWDLVDHDVALIDTRSLAVSYRTGLMNVCMALAVNPRTGQVTVVGTDGTNEVRFEPNLTGTFGRVLFASAKLVVPSLVGAPTVAVRDLNDHLDYSVPTVVQSLRDRSLGDPRGIVWNAQGTRGYVSGMGSNNVVVIDAQGRRAGIAPTIEVGQGPTGLALDEDAGRLYVLNKFEGSVSVIDTATETEVQRVSFFDPTPALITTGREHLYGTHENSGLGQVACATCHVDARMDRLGWDLGDPSGDMKGLSGQNLGANVPGLNTGFQPHHPMKGPMTTQTLQDIIGHEPLHWRGDRDGLEEFNGAFIGLQGDDANLSPVEMQEFEDFLGSIHFPPNPYRELDNSLPTDLPLPGHVSGGRFTPAGTPLPNGDAQRGLALYRPPTLLDNPFACVSCHTLPTGTGTDMTRSGLTNLVPIPPGPNGEHHHMLVSVDGSTNVTMKVPQLRNQYDKHGFDATSTHSLAGFGVLHDGSVDTVARFVEEPTFALQSVQDTADLVAFMLAFTGSDLPQGTPNILNLEPPGTASQDTHAAVGRQATFDSPTPPAASQALVMSLVSMASTDDIGLIVKGRAAGLARGWYYDSVAGLFQSDRAAETSTLAMLVAAAGAGSELTFTAVPEGSEVRMGVDRDSDGWFDRDELDLGSDPADPQSTPGAAPLRAPSTPGGLRAVPLGTDRVNLSWLDTSANEAGFELERSPAGADRWESVATLPPGATAWPDTGLPMGVYDYRLRAFNAAGRSGHALARAVETAGGAVSHRQREHLPEVDRAAYRGTH